MKIVRTLFILILTFSLSSCEKEQTPLTLDDYIFANGKPEKKFSVELNGFLFESDSITAVKVNGQLALIVADQNVSFVINSEKLKTGTFLGSANDLKNYVNYKDAANAVFSTTKFGENSNAVINVSNFNESNKLVSGEFSGTMYDLNSSFQIQIQNGKFKNVLVDIPFIGELTATVSGNTIEADGCYHSSTVNAGITLETIAATANSDTISMSFVIEESIQLKEYNLAIDPVTVHYNSNTFSSNIFKNQYTSESGKLTIIKIDVANNRIEGSFNFTARNFLNETVQIDNGLFKALMQ